MAAARPRPSQPDKDTTMKTLTLEELTTVDGGFCFPFGLEGALIYAISGGEACWGIHIT
jgi:hypothetical protein